MHSAISRLRERWLSQGILNPLPATDLEVQAFEARYRVRLPDELRAYFLEVNGTRGGAYGMDDKDLLGFWHLKDVRSFAEEAGDAGPHDEHTFVFADHSICVYAFGVRLSADPLAAAPILTDVGGALSEVSPSFGAFVDRYLSGDDEVIYPDP